ncbi:type I secretion system ATPase [compost metagenome]
MVILDEPTSAFDQASEARVIEFMKDWLKARTALIATHKRDLLALTQRAVVLNEGRVVHDGDMSSMFMQGAKRPANAVGIKVVTGGAAP